MASKILGVENLQAALKEMTALSSSEWRSTMDAAVRKPMKAVMATAKQNIAKISPGKALYHWTYRHRVVAAGFASRSLVMSVHVHPENGVSVANLGVTPEAFYALQFFELGLPSRGIPRTPWLVPALESSQGNSVQAVNDAVTARINKIAAKHANVTPT